MAIDFTVSDVLAWARTKPADETYNFLDASNCAIARFGKETGRDDLINLLSDEIPLGLLRAVNPVGSYDWTYGALVARLEALVQETPAKPSPWLNPQTYVDADCGERVL